MIKKNKGILAALLCCCVYDASFCMEANRRASARRFTRYENEIILACVRSLDDAEPNWSDIARGLPGRTARQVREHSEQLGYGFAPEQSRVSWTQEEDAILIEKRRELGNRWGKIAEFLPGRSYSSVSGRWHSVLSKRSVQLTPAEQTRELIDEDFELIRAQMRQDDDWLPLAEQLGDDFC
jgi:hypothetical protein